MASSKWVFRAAPRGSYRSRCLFPTWTWGRNLWGRCPCRGPHRRPSSPGRCAAAWTWEGGGGGKVSFLWLCLWMRTCTRVENELHKLLTIASEPCCSRDVGNLTSLTLKLTILCDISAHRLSLSCDRSGFCCCDLCKLTPPTSPCRAGLNIKDEA